MFSASATSSSFTATVMGHLARTGASDISSILIAKHDVQLQDLLDVLGEKLVKTHEVQLRRYKAELIEALDAAEAAAGLSPISASASPTRADAPDPPNPDETADGSLSISRSLNLRSQLLAQISYQQDSGITDSLDQQISRSRFQRQQQKFHIVHTGHPYQWQPASQAEQEEEGRPPPTRRQAAAMQEGTSKGAGTEEGVPPPSFSALSDDVDVARVGAAAADDPVLAAFASAGLGDGPPTHLPLPPSRERLVVLVRHGERLDEVDRAAWHRMRTVGDVMMLHCCEPNRLTE
jgi:hypothetical protein